jgi:hypothetical protein
MLQLHCRKVQLQHFLLHVQHASPCPPCSENPSWLLLLLLSLPPLLTIAQ